MDYRVEQGLGIILTALQDMPEKQVVSELNSIRTSLHDVSPFSGEPVDLVLWVESDQVYANDYNPNSVAPPEMELLKTSILQDGYTQPIVSFPTDEGFEVVDGFHRNRVGKEDFEVRARVKNYLPITRIKSDRMDKADRIASTIRHNRARGKHRVDAMSDIVIELKRRNWSDDKIGRELGMDTDEVLRLTQITGLAEMFKDSEFTMSWDVDALMGDESEFDQLTEEDCGEDISHLG